MKTHYRVPACQPEHTRSFPLTVSGAKVLQSYNQRRETSGRNVTGVFNALSSNEMTQQLRLSDTALELYASFISSETTPLRREKGK